MGGIHTSIIKSTQKEYRCGFCPEPIPKGSMCISAFGYDYDDEQVNERIHIKPKCYEEWVNQIDMLEPEDIKKMIEEAQQVKVKP